jgi:dipeptidyl aminopeptidase/acylaminoacyl peptidase
MRASYRAVAQLKSPVYDAGMIAPFGSWKSPVTTDLIVAESVSLGQIALDGDDVYWLEGRPREAGRNVIVKNGVDVTPPGFNARTRVHEYGGGAFAVADGVVYFTNDKDQQLYRDTTPLTDLPGVRFADMILDRKRERLICVCEDHRAGGEPSNSIIAVPGEALVSGNDFYSSPRLSPDGQHLAYLTWNHPNMPWDETELWIGSHRIAGGASIAQPEWSPDGILHFISDQTGWWNLYRHRNGKIEHLFDTQAEFGAPQWVFGMSTYAFEAPDRIVCAYNKRGRWRLARLDTTHKSLELIETPYTDISQLRANGRQVVFLGASPTEPTSVVRLTGEILRRSTSATLDPRYVSVAKPIEFPTEDGLTAHAFYYPPKNDDFAGPNGERPPLSVMSHGGPTGATTNGFSLQKQFWTSRGFAVVDVNYGGSTGYGREYRERLEANWGIVDVYDCLNAARYLVERGKADGTRLAIRGGSAGGYTTLCALTFHTLFRAGACYYGISDLEASEDTHKFESRYNHRLIAPFPEGREVYRQRSPIFFLEKLNCPIIFFQGLEDKIVLPNQSERMVEAMKKKGLPVAYLAFEGEQHGFRKADTIKRTLEAELYFYSRVFGFPLADAVKPVMIENLAG